MPKKVMVALSGGVDSSVAALMAVEAGYCVEGIFMKNWEEDDEVDSCPVLADLEDAQAVSSKLNIPLHTVNFSVDYWHKVFSYFIRESKLGRTPNPDVLCNQHIKFKSCLNYALELGADKLVTGHYARIDQENNHYQLLKGVDKLKDQSYFLHLLTQEQLQKSLFPLGGMQKSAVRARAKEAGLPTASKKDSTGICFIGKRNFRKFLQNYIPSDEGDIVDEKGRYIKKHQGLAFYTIGQRRGLEIGGGCGSLGAWYVVEKDLVNNRLIVAPEDDLQSLYHHSVLTGRVTWIGEAPRLPSLLQARVRYRQVPAVCRVEQVLGSPSALRVLFEEAQRAVTPGQFIVLYDGDLCLGGAVIEERL